MSWPKRVRAVVEERSQGVCEGCRRRRGENLHHRQYKSRGGLDVACNALWLCGFGNTSGCHGRAHSGDGAELGWAVPRWARPELWPAWRIDAGWVLYLDVPDTDGRWWQPISHATADLLMNGTPEGG